MFKLCQWKNARTYLFPGYVLQSISVTEAFRTSSALRSCVSPECATQLRRSQSHGFPGCQADNLYCWDCHLYCWWCSKQCECTSGHCFLLVQPVDLHKWNHCRDHSVGLYLSLHPWDCLWKSSKLHICATFSVLAHLCVDGAPESKHWNIYIYIYSHIYHIYR